MRKVRKDVLGQFVRVRLPAPKHEPIHQRSNRQLFPVVEEHIPRLFLHEGKQGSISYDEELSGREMVREQVEGSLQKEQRGLFRRYPRHKPNTNNIRITGSIHNIRITGHFIILLRRSDSRCPWVDHSGVNGVENGSFSALFFQEVPQLFPDRRQRVEGGSYKVDMLGREEMRWGVSEGEEEAF